MPLWALLVPPHRGASTTDATRCGPLPPSLRAVAAEPSGQSTGPGRAFAAAIGADTRDSMPESRGARDVVLITVDAHAEAMIGTLGRRSDDSFRKGQTRDCESGSIATGCSLTNG